MGFPDDAWAATDGLVREFLDTAQQLRIPPNHTWKSGKLWRKRHSQWRIEIPAEDPVLAYYDPEELRISPDGNWWLMKFRSGRQYTVVDAPGKGWDLAPSGEFNSEWAVGSATGGQRAMKSWVGEERLRRLIADFVAEHIPHG